MNILVCGSRNFGNVVRTKSTIYEETEETQNRIKEYKFIHDTLNKLVMKYSKEYKEDDNWLPTDITIITGAAQGADSAASDFAICHYCQLKEFPADWKKHGKAAGHIRNQQMLDEGKPDLVVAFPGGSGTKNMIDKAKKSGIMVIQYDMEN